LFRYVYFQKEYKKGNLFDGSFLTAMALIGMIAPFFCEKNANAAQAGGGQLEDAWES
jgi:hypothetical protein